LLHAKSQPSFTWFSFHLCRFFSLLQSTNTISLYVPVRPSGVRHFARFVPIDLAQQWQGKILNLEHCKHHKKPFKKRAIMFDVSWLLGQMTNVMARIMA
jgi:hypothetical protein